MLYKERNTGVRLTRVPSVDLTVLAVMMLLVMAAWGVSRIDRVLTRPQMQIPVFTISQELSVVPVVEPKMKKDAVKVGKFMSLAKSGTVTKASSAAKADMSVLNKIVLAQAVPQASTLTAPRIVYKSMPDYPVKAIEEGLQGTVLVKIYILKNGRVGNALVEQTSGHEVLDRSAIAAVSQWIFEPAVYSKDATEAWFKIPVKFQLKS